jgi:hypothetical protein
MAEEDSTARPIPDPMGDDTRAAVVRQLTDWWSAHPHPEIRKLSPATIRQMAMEAGAFARGIMGEIAELKQLAEPETKAGGE